MNGSSVKDVKDYMILHAYFIDMFANYKIKTLKKVVVVAVVTLVLAFVYCAKSFTLYNKNLKEKIKLLNYQKTILKSKILEQQ